MRLKRLRESSVSVDEEVVPDDVDDIGGKHDIHGGERVGCPVAELLEGVEQHGEDNREQLQDVVRPYIRV